MKQYINSTSQNIINIKNEEYDFFLDYTEKNLINWPHEQRENRILILSSSLVGFIVTPYRQIEVKPKYKEINFNHVLRLYLYLNLYKKDNTSKLLDVNPSSDFDISKTFLNELEMVLKNKRYRTYKAYSERGSVVKGRIKVSATYKNLIQFKEKPVVTQCH